MLFKSICFILLSSWFYILYGARGGAAAARRAHNPKVAGSSPAPATKIDFKIGPDRNVWAYFVFSSNIPNCRIGTF